MAKICLINPHHVSFQPRILREADSLSEAGHNVRVVSRQLDSERAEHDQRLMRSRRWRLQTVDLLGSRRNQISWLQESIQSKLSRYLFDAGLKNPAVAVRGYIKGSGAFAEAASLESADWFIAHTQGALPAAAIAAAKWNARLGFDCEDLLAESGTDPANIVRLIESKYLPLCDYVSVPSKCVGDRLIKQYRISSPIVLYNVFPLHLAEGMIPPAQRTRDSVLRLHWFGQTLGPDRGIEEAIEAAGQIEGRVELHLRGRISETYKARVLTLAQHHGIVDKIKFHPLINHDDLIRTMGQYDVGLCLERPTHGNYAVTITNKLFSYLLAGLAVAATDTLGHREALEKAPSAGILYTAGDVQALAVKLQRWLDNPDALLFAQQAAWQAARTRFCWDKEKQKLFDVIDGRFSNHADHAEYLELPTKNDSAKSRTEY